MKSKFIGVMILSIFICISVFSFAQGQEKEEASGPILILEEAQQRKKDFVGVVVNLIDDILNVTIFARMHATKPNIYNVTLEGPGIGRMSPKERRTLHPTAEDEQIEFSTKKLEGGFIRLTPKVRKKKLKGTLTKEIARFKIPKDKIRPKKRYMLKIKIESLQNPGQYKTYKFELEKLAEAVAQQKD